MATKAQELAGLKNRTTCLGKAADEEPLFVLRAQDKLMPTVVRIWKELALFHGLPYERQADCDALIRAAEHWQRIHHLSVKFPD